MGAASLLRAARACATCIVLLAVPALAGAQPSYSWELSGLELSNNLSDFDSTAVGATYYFDSVEDRGSPYALAPFLDPATLVSATASRLSPNTDTWTVNGRYLLDSSLWYVGARVTHDAYTAFDADSNAYGLVAGKYLGPRTTLELGIDRSRYEYRFCSFPQCPLLTVTGINTTDTASLSVFHVRQFRSLTYVLDGGVLGRETHFRLNDNRTVPSLALPQQGSSPTTRTYSVGTTLYPTKKLGVRVGYEDTFGGDFAGYIHGTYSVGTRWFFHPKVALELWTSRTYYDTPFALYGRDPRTRSLSIVGRF